MDANKIRWVQPYTLTRYLLKEDVVEFLRANNASKLADEIEETDGVNNAPKNPFYKQIY